MPSEDDDSEADPLSMMAADEAAGGNSLRGSSNDHEKNAKKIKNDPDQILAVKKAIESFVQNSAKEPHLKKIIIC